MTEKLLLINPAKPPSKRRAPARRVKPKAKRRKTMATKKRRTAAQKRATAKMVAANRRRRNPIRRKRRAPAKRRAVARKPARSYRKRAPAARRRRNPIRRYKRRSNPVRRMSLQGILNKLVIPAVTAAGGALALDALWAYLPLPINIKTGPMKHVAKASGAVGMWLLAGNVVNKRMADALGLGALTVVVHQAAKEFMAINMPQIRLDGMGYYPQANNMGYMSPALPAGTRNRNQAPGMGYYPPMNNSIQAPVESENNYNYT